MQLLYPDIKPYDQQWIEVESPHQLYLEQSGTPDGIPVLVVHGGPGEGCEPAHRRYFDPEKYRIIVYDQRGAGQSRPHASVEKNTTQALIEDIEFIRKFLNIDKWMLFGGSWGATLSLAYAEQHPEQIRALILRAVFLGRQQDFNWLYKEGTSKIYPDFWEDFIHPIPENERDNLLKAYSKRLFGEDEIARMSAAKAWAIWKGRTATLQSSHKTIKHYSKPRLALSLSRIEVHYFINQCFLKENQLLKNASKLKDIPGIIVHGRYDMICPLENAWSLVQAWPNAELQVIRDAGHSAFEPGNIDALIRATKTMAIRLEQDG